MSESTDMELLHRAWEAMSAAGDLSVLEGALTRRRSGAASRTGRGYARTAR
jgi:hypothetical protein